MSSRHPDTRADTGTVSTLITSRTPARLVLEGLTIVVGILLAFGIDAWWDNRNAATAERALLGDVIEELEQIATVLDGAGAVHEEQRSASGAIVGDGGPLGEREMAEAVANLLGFVTLDVSTGALDAALSSDGLGRIASDSTRMLLARWPGAYLDVVENEVLELDLVEHSLHPLLRTRLSVPDLVSFTRVAGLSQDTAAVAVRRVRDTAALMRDLRRLNDDREFQGLVFQLNQNDSAIAGEYEELKRLIASIIEAAETSLDR
ncbi:MAG: hypothetical protein ACC682_16375 [Gemmatimonadota bacterium]